MKSIGTTATLGLFLLSGCDEPDLLGRGELLHGELGEVEIAAEQPADEVVVVEDAAERASNPYTATGVCGNGYYIQKKQAIRGAIIYLLYNGSHNCVVTIKTASIGRRTYTSAELVVQNGGSDVDLGYYKYYAGPVKLPARGKCVMWGGSTQDDYFFNNEWVHCG